MEQSIREHQLKAVEALKHLNEILDKNNIQYYGIAGTALGAVRHKGFIPWDDDIDIGMTMDHFSRFIKIAPDVIRYPYTWKHTSVNENYETLSGRIYYREDEPLITIFPLVKLSDKKIPRKMQWITRKIMSLVWQSEVRHQVTEEYLNSAKYRKVTVEASKVIAALMPKRVVLSILNKNEVRYENSKTEWYCNIYSKYSMEKESIKAQWLQESIKLPFEDTYIYVVKDYDAYLTHLYGDYMTPPPEADRHPAHI